MKNCLSPVILRSLLGVLLLATLGGCGAYRSMFHPYRLPTPKPSPEFLAQQKADKQTDKQARKANRLVLLFKKKAAPPPEGAATDVSGPTGNPVAAAPPVAPIATAAAPEARTLPERATVHYDKAGLMEKKPQLLRRRIHKQSKPFHPWQSIRNFFKYGLHAKPNYSPDHRPAAPPPAAVPADAVPVPAPTGKP